MKKLIIGLCMTFMLPSMPLYGMTQYSIVLAETKEQSLDSRCVEGKVLSDVNVRTGAGSKFKKVVVDGKTIILRKGQTVTIVENPDHKNQAWYEVKITVNGKEITGYSSSKYIKKTEEVVIPTPVPTKVPTPVPTKVPESITTTENKLPDSNTTEQETTRKDKDVAESEKNSSDQKERNMEWYAGIILMILVGAGAMFYYFNKKAKQRSKKMDELAAKIAEQTKMELSQKRLMDAAKTQMKENQSTKAATANHEEKGREQHKQTSSDVRVIKGDQIISRDKLITGNRDVYVMKQQKDMITAQMELAAALTVEQIDSSDTTENPLKKQVKSPQEKQQFRIRLNELKEHDKIIHKYFGEGEVYDNSDVKIIEIRFGKDTRFLNKDNLAVNHLLTIVDQ